MAIALLPLSVLSAETPTRITVGSKAFTESVILAEVLHHLARHAGAEAVHQRQLGGTRVVWNALLSGDIDAYPEYTGTLLREILAGENLCTQAELQQALAARGVRMTDSLGFNNSYAIGVKQSLARQLDLHRISDLKNHPELVFGFGNEFMNRADGWPAHIFLLFIAFNFTISNQLPRLGYITFMDAYLVSTFIITSIVVLINVQLRRQKKLGHIEVTETIDHYVLWAYPLIYIFGAIITFGIYIIN